MTPSDNSGNTSTAPSMKQTGAHRGAPRALPPMLRRDGVRSRAAQPPRRVGPRRHTRGRAAATQPHPRGAGPRSQDLMHSAETKDLVRGAYRNLPPTTAAVAHKIYSDAELA